MTVNLSSTSTFSNVSREMMLPTVHVTSLTRKYLTESQNVFFKDLRIGTILPGEGDEAQVVPAESVQDEDDTNIEDELCGGSKDENPPEEYLFCINNTIGIFKCENFNPGEGSNFFSQNVPTLLLDTPICRDGTVANRAKLTVPFPLSVRKSRIEINKDGIWTDLTLPSNLLLGPYETTFKTKAENHFHNQENGSPWLPYIKDNFFNSEDSCLSNWLSLIASSTDQNLTNLIPLIYKNCIFFHAIDSIPRESELVVWSGNEITLKDLVDSCCIDDGSTYPSSDHFDSSHECPWCSLQFVNSKYLLEHKNHCSFQKESDLTESIEIEEIFLVDDFKENETVNSYNGGSAGLRRSNRIKTRTVRYFISPECSPHNNVKQEKEPDHVCQYCKLAFTSAYTLRRHVECHSNEVKFICMHCGLSFMDEATLKRHKGNHNSTEMDYPEELRIDRSIFSPQQRSKSPVLVEKDYTYHLGNEKCVFDLPWVKTLLNMNKDLRSNKSSALQCSSCETQFYNKDAAALHERTCMEGVKPYKCGHCCKRFQLYFSIVKHMTKHEEIEGEILVNSDSVYARLLNETCEAVLAEDEDKLIYQDLQDPTKEISRSVALQNGSFPSDDVECTMIRSDVEDSNVFCKEEHHLDVNTEPLENDDKIDCHDPIVGKLSTMDEFMAKLEITEAACGGRYRRHECNICGQRFFRRKHIKKHMELHDNETSRVFRCSSCPLWFGTPDMVQCHEEKRHSGQSKPLVPTKMEFEPSFLRKLLNVLAKESQKGRYCEYFNAKETIKDKKFECEICTKKFTSFYRIRKHKIVTHHELMDMLEAVNELIDSKGEEQLVESNILSVLSSLTEENVLNKMKELKKEVDKDEKIGNLSNIRMGLYCGEREDSDDENPFEDSCNQDKSIRFPDSDDNDNKCDDKSSVCSLFEAKHLLEASAAGKLLLQKGIQISRVFSLSNTEDNKDQNCDDDDEDTQSKSNFILSQSSDQNFGIDLNRVISETLVNSSFAYSSSHQRQIYNEKIMKKCQICGKKLSPKTNMRTHMQSHTGERRYECTYCHNRYALLSTLKRHVRIHTNDRPFTCDVCQKAYTQSSNLKRHYRQHTGERPFRCAFCPKRYAEKFSLNRHLKCHKEAKAHKCKLCGKGFAEQYHLIRHLNNMHGMDLTIQ